MTNLCVGNLVLEKVLRDRGLGSSNECYNVMYYVARLNDCKTIVEIGTHQGASAIAFCQAILDNGKTPEIYTVDNWSQASVKSIAVSNFECAGFAKYITMVEGNSDAVLPGLFERIKRCDLVFVDGCHNESSVLSDYANVKKYTDLILFHDTMDGTVNYLKIVKDDGNRLFHFSTRYVEGDNHLVGITLAKRGTVSV
jgi:predicted O-methyltransferase YrrM